jgi:hypothetical protein
LYETARKKKEAKAEKNFIGSLFSTYLQEYETKIVSSMLKWLVEETPFTKLEGCDLTIATYEYGGGIKLRKDLVDKYGKELLLSQLNEQTFALTGFRLKWEEKEIEDYLDIYEFINQPDSTENPHEMEAMFGVNNDLEGAEKVFKLYPHWVYFKGKLFVFNNKTDLWDTDKVTHDEVIKDHTKYLFINDVKDKEGNLVKSDSKSYGNTASLRDQLHGYIKPLCRNDNWLKEKQCSSLGELLFNNGLLFDAKEGKFYDKATYGFNSNIVFFGKIHQDFVQFTKEDMEYVKGIRTRLFYNPLGKEQGNFLITNLARGRMGNTMKRILFGL